MAKVPGEGYAYVNNLGWPVRILSHTGAEGRGGEEAGDATQTHLNQRVRKQQGGGLTGNGVQLGALTTRASRGPGPAGHIEP